MWDPPPDPDPDPPPVSEPLPEPESLPDPSSEPDPRPELVFVALLVVVAEALTALALSLVDADALAVPPAAEALCEALPDAATPSLIWAAAVASADAATACPPAL